jgi:hypothetical protein
MNITNIPYKVYKYYFSIDNIEQAKLIQSKIDEQLNKCNFDKSDLNLLIDYSKDFTSICNDVINRNNITTSEEYKISIKTLKIINSNAQSLLYSKKYKHNINIMIIKDCYNEIDKYISFSKKPESLFLIYIFSMLTVFISTILIFKNFINNTFVYLSLLALFIILIVLPLIFYKWFGRKLKCIANIITNKINNYKGQKTIEKLNNCLNNIQH